MARKNLGAANAPAAPLPPAGRASAAARRAQGRVQRKACPFDHLAQAPKAGPKSPRDPVTWLDTSNQAEPGRGLPRPDARLRHDGHAGRRYYRLTSNTLLKLGGKDPAELAVIRKARRGTVRVFAEEATRRVDGRLMIRPGSAFAYDDKRATQRELEAFRRGLGPFIAQYRASLPVERRALFDRYALNDVAVMTPGVGSVGRRCFLLLLVADGMHPLFLQCKEAGASVLQASPGTKGQARPGERVVHGQRLMQAASDIFLGWGRVEAVGDFYVRQLRDMKGAYDHADFSAKDLKEYAEACGYGLARAHAKGGDASTIRGYLGTSARFNESLATFAAAYADVNEADWNALRRAKAPGRAGTRTRRR